MLNLRPADCGHWIPADAEPVGTHDGDGAHSPQPVYMCQACEAALRAMFEPEPKPEPKDRVEIKAVTPEPRQKRVGEIEISEATLAVDDPYWQGRSARTKGVNQADNPYDGRSKDGRNWQRGWYEGGEVAGGKK